MAVKKDRTMLSWLRVPLEVYLKMDGAKVYSLVASVPFSPIDIDLGHLARGEWNALTDRFRVWYLPSDGEGDGYPTCYVMIRKFDPQDGVLLYGHVLVNLGKKIGAEDQTFFTVGIMSNDEVRARSMLNSMLEIPPSFHSRDEVRLIEHRWRSDPDSVMRFLANIHSALAQQSPDPSGKVYALKFEPPPGLINDFKQNLNKWW